MATEIVYNLDLFLSTVEAARCVVFAKCRLTQKMQVWLIKEIKYLQIT